MESPSPIMDKDEVVERGGADPDEAFRAFVDPHTDALHAHCYRMLGSVHDADDALQEALIRAWRAFDRFEGRSKPRTWLHRIATNTCLDLVAKRPKRVLPIDYGPPVDDDGGAVALEDSLWVEPYPGSGLHGSEPEARYEEREAIELAFVAALQHLPPRQRGALILRDVLGFSAREVGEALDTTTASVNSALQRARKTIADRLPDESQQATMRALGDARVQRIVDSFVAAFEAGEVSAIVELLAEEVTFQMPPYAEWSRGRDAVASSWLMPEAPGARLRYVETVANGQPALGTYALDDESGLFEAIALDVLALSDRGVVAVYAFRDRRMFSRFSLPASLSGDAA